MSEILPLFLFIRLNYEQETQKYPKEDISAMRETLHESEWEGLKDRDLRLMLWEGCVGWENMPDEEVVEHYENIYGETDNVGICYLRIKIALKCL